MTRRAGAICIAMLVAFLPPPVAAQPSRHGNHLKVGSLVLTRCHVFAGAYCGRLRRPWDPGGAVKGHLSVGFAFIPASDHHDPVLGTVVPQEGGPGYSTTGSAIDYTGMYGPLLRRRNLLLVDQRGTGRTALIDCPELQNLHGPYNVAARTCGRALGNHSDLYSSELSADDQAAVINALEIGKVDAYGDSYGTFFTQVFVGRHPDLVRSIVLDSAYPPTGESAWYPTQGPAMRHALTIACRRGPACASAPGKPIELMRRVLKQVRQEPYRGTGYDADGVRHHAVVTGAALVGVAFGATYGPEYYRELAAALRSALHGNHKALLRLVAETNDASSDAGPAKFYSEGLDAAVTCQDYPQLFDLADPPAKRRQEYHAAVRLEQKHHPHVYAPFTIKEYLHSVWEEADWCLKWPAPSAAHPAGPPAPPSGHYPSVPTLVLSGELDTITTPAEGALVTAQFPNGRQIHVANSFHVTAEDDTDGCGASVLRRTGAHPGRPLSTADLRCTGRVPPVRALGRYHRSFTSMAPAKSRHGNAVGVLGRRATATAAETAADVLDRCFNNYSSQGVGLYGGTWRYTGNRNLKFHLHHVRLTRDLAVGGQVRWSRYHHQLTCHLTVAGPGISGSLHGHWDTRRLGAIAHLSGQVRGRPLDASMVAP